MRERKLSGESTHDVDYSVLKRKLHGSPGLPGWCGLTDANGRSVARINDQKSWSIDLSFSCDTPWRRIFRAKHVYRTDKSGGWPRLLSVAVYYRCRRCPRCMKQRANQWAEKAKVETQFHPRTWFGTITLSPSEHAILDVKVAKRNLDTRLLTPDERFRARAQVFAVEIGRWLKRVRIDAQRRHNTQDSICRYLLVAEKHDSSSTSDQMRGRPHFHILLHETWIGALVEGNPLRALETPGRADGEVVWFPNNNGKPCCYLTDASTVRKQWKLGFTKFELCTDVNSAIYLCKYLSKDMLWRVHASQHYGDEAWLHLPISTNGDEGADGRSRPAQEKWIPQGEKSMIISTDGEA